MGFGFNLAIVFVFPVFFLVTLLILVYNIGKNKRIVRLILISWGVVVSSVFSLIAVESVTKFFTEKKQLERNDIYGSYVIDRPMYPGKQSDWQYNHYKFEITTQDSFKLYYMEKGRIVKTYKAKVKFLDGYKYRLTLKADSPGYHLIDSVPTLYRRVFSFYYVFTSPLYHNVFFTKGDWKPIDTDN
jgi:hypothetical protein